MARLPVLGTNGVDTSLVHLRVIRSGRGVGLMPPADAAGARWAALVGTAGGPAACWGGQPWRPACSRRDTGHRPPGTRPSPAMPPAQRAGGGGAPGGHLAGRPTASAGRGSQHAPAEAPEPSSGTHTQPGSSAGRPAAAPSLAPARRRQAASRVNTLRIAGWLLNPLKRRGRRRLEDGWPGGASRLRSALALHATPADVGPCTAHAPLRPPVWACLGPSEPFCVLRRTCMARLAASAVGSARYL